MKNYLILLFFLVSNSILNSQVLEITPAFPTVNDDITIIYNAEEGNGALQGISPIYAHAGLITASSNSPTDWKYVVSDWGIENDKVLMQDLGNNLHQISFNIKEYYGVPDGEEVYKLAFVFRNANGSIVGRATDGSDIYYDVVTNENEFQARFFKPDDDFIFVESNETINIKASCNQNSNISILKNNISIFEEAGIKDAEISETVTDNFNQFEFIANNGIEEIRDTFYTLSVPEVEVAELPYELEDGITYLSENTVFLKLFAPYKNNICVIGDFNNWIPSPEYFMKRTPDASTWWLEINNLEPQKKYAFQYWVDGELKIADPYSTLIADSWNDSQIDEIIYPNPVPTSNFSGRASIIQTAQENYVWQTTNYTRPENKDLVIYELLIRDFFEEHSYLAVMDSLDYLQNLGINAIELMPVSEFENNESWGYNSSYQMALDKYYGTPEHFKMFIDECHSRGIAVIMDIVFNHAYGQNPYAQLWWDAENNQPAINNPFFNTSCPHPPFCWGNDFDHSSQRTKDYMDKINRYWLEEFKIDGFRFDFTKGMTNSGNGDFNQERIDNLKRMADAIWETNPNAYVILEHFAGNNEEKTLSDYGMMLWGNMSYAYQEGAMGYLSGSNLEYGIYQARNWNNPHLVTYMESHDEERIMFKNLAYGNANGNYNIKELHTALRRCELNSVMFLAQPGPKMIWQFGELGYDISIDYECRVCNKPILWNYFEENNRKRLYQVYQAMLALRNEYAVFNTDNFSWNLSGANKTIHLYHEDFDAVILGNYDLQEQDFAPSFSKIGWWYEYFSGDSIYVDYPLELPTFEAGEYRIYTSEKLSLPTPEIVSNINILDELLAEDIGLNMQSNLVNQELIFELNLFDAKDINISIFNTEGKKIKQILNNKQLVNLQQFKINTGNMPSGMYYLLIQANDKIGAFEFVKSL